MSTLTSTAFADPIPFARQPGAAELARQIERLGVVGSVLYVAAHPDDENTRLLAWLANERQVRAAYLSLTRGEGGQNLIGPEQGPLLGLIRTQELLAARRVDGAEQLFTRARDFGYSKTPDETLAIWNRDEVLADVVRVIRRFKPDVIITRFSPTTKTGETHGHHIASAMLAEAAFKAAADPQYHPEEVAQLGAWQARRIVWNKSSFFVKPNEDLSGYVKLDIGAYNPALGASYGEIAADSRSMHKSQGFGAARSRGPNPEYFQLIAGEPMNPGVLDGIDWTWGRVKGSEALAALLKRARAEYRPESPVSSIPVLVEAREALLKLPDNPWKAQKLAELTRVIEACAGLFVEATAADFDAVAGSELAVTAVALNRAGAPIQLEEVRLPGGVTIKSGKALPANEPVQIEQKLTVPANLDVTSPFWLTEAPAAGTWTVADRDLIGPPEQPSPLVAEFVLKSGASTFSVTRPIAYKWTDPVMGERYRAVEIVPRAAVNPTAPVLMFPDGKAKELRLRIKAGIADVAGAARLELPPQWKAEPVSIAFKIANKGAEEEVVFRVTPPATPPKGGFAPIEATLRAVVEVNGKANGRGLVRIENAHIPIQTLFPVAEVKLVRFDLKHSKRRLGYIPGAGDEVASALRGVGYDVTILDDEALRDRPLAAFEAIVVGVRAYNTNARLPQHYKKLMDYVQAGGTLLVQYNTNNRLSKLPAELGPFPFEVSQDRVTEENAEIRYAIPSHPTLTKPNAIGPADLKGWVQERGLYFAGKWDERYQAPLSMNDAGEPERKGALLVGKHGKGAFIYTGLAFFRQLPAGVPGAYRLFANLIDHGK